MIPLQTGEATEAIKQLSNIEQVTVYGVLFLVIVGLISFVIYLIRKIDKREAEERALTAENIKMLNEFTNSINTRNSTLEEVKTQINDVSKDTTKILIYIEQKTK